MPASKGVSLPLQGADSPASVPLLSRVYAAVAAGRASLAHLVAPPPGDLGGKLRACGNVQLGEDVREVCLDGPV